MKYALIRSLDGIKTRSYAASEKTKTYMISWSVPYILHYTCCETFPCYRFCTEIAINSINSAHLVYFFVSERPQSVNFQRQVLNHSFNQRAKRTGFADTDDLLNRLAGGDSHPLLHNNLDLRGTFSDNRNRSSHRNMVGRDPVDRSEFLSPRSRWRRQEANTMGSDACSRALLR